MYINRNTRYISSIQVVDDLHSLFNTLQPLEGNRSEAVKTWTLKRIHQETVLINLVGSDLHSKCPTPKSQLEGIITRLSNTFLCYITQTNFLLENLKEIMGSVMCCFNGKNWSTCLKKNKVSNRGSERSFRDRNWRYD